MRRLALLSLLFFSPQGKTQSHLYPQLLHEYLPDTAQLMSHVRILASEEFAGRGTFSEGEIKAAEYIIQHFHSLGLKPQTMEFPVTRRLAPRCKVYFTSGKDTLREGLFCIAGFRDTVFDISGSFFAGEGLDTAQFLNFSRKASGKLVIMDPNLQIKDDVIRREWQQYPEMRLRAARKYGASAVFFSGIPEVMEPVLKENLKNKKVRFRDDFNSESIPYVMGDENALTWLKAHKFRFRWHQEEIQPYGINVFATVPGTDLAHEWIVVSAHYDHLGRSGNEIYYGADDNGSGTSALLELASCIYRMAANGLGPRRSVMFVAFSGEELGLLGSAWFVEHSPVSLRQIVLNLNVDMIGRNDAVHHFRESYLYLIGSDRISKEVHRISDSLLQAEQFTADYFYNDPDEPMKLYERSDHFNFCKYGIPAIFYFSGLHEDYHKTTDTPDKIQGRRLGQNAGIIFKSLWTFANHPGISKKR